MQNINQHHGWEYCQIDECYFKYEGEYLYKVFRLNRFNWLFLVVLIDPSKKKRDLLYTKGFKGNYKKIVEADAFDFANTFDINNYLSLAKN